MWHVWETGEVHTGLRVGDLKERCRLEVVGIYGTIIFKWILNKWDGEAGTGLIGLRVGTGGGLCECGNEPSGFIKCGEFLDWLRTG